MNAPVWKVPYVYLSRQFADIKPYIAALRDTVARGDFTLGKKLAEFESNVAKRLRVKHAIGVASGTDALILSLRVLGIGPGDEVITAPNTFVATAASIAMVGAKPVFVDVCDNYTIDPEKIKPAITKKTRAIIPVHLTGWAADMKPIMRMAKRHNLHVVEDAAQAFLTTYDGQCVGTFGAMGAYSFHPLKIVNVWGDGGMVVTSNDEYAKNLRLWRNHGLRTREEVEFFALNSRLDTIHAALASVMLPRVDGAIRKRAAFSHRYDRRLSRLEPFVHLPAKMLQSVSVEPVYAYYVIQVQKRNELQAYLKEKGIETVIQYPIPLHLQKAAKYLGYKRGDFPVCEKQADSILTLPNNQYLHMADIEYVCECIEAFYGS